MENLRCRRWVTEIQENDESLEDEHDVLYPDMRYTATYRPEKSKAWCLRNGQDKEFCTEEIADTLMEVKMNANDLYGPLLLIEDGDPFDCLRDINLSRLFLDYCSTMLRSSFLVHSTAAAFRGLACGRSSLPQCPRQTIYRNSTNVGRLSISWYETRPVRST